MRRHQSGFTLIEIAIVLVIIGLLLGGILKGQELINSARVKNLATDFRNIPIFIYAYQDAYRAIPGDDAEAGAHVGGTPTPVVLTRGNGIINGNWDSGNNADESFLFWQHIRLADFAPGTDNLAAPDYLPRNAAGGRVGVQGGAPYTSMNRGAFFICSEGIEGRFAQQLDVQLDDGNPATGSMQSGLAPNTGVAATAAPLNPAVQYIVCMGI
mgnify:CR=1 FL=1